MKPPRLQNRSGFTLVEILAASTIMLVLMLIVLQLSFAALNGWNRSQAQLGTNTEAQLAMGRLESDIGGMIFRETPGGDKYWLEIQWDSAVTIGNVVLPKPPIIMFYSNVEDPVKYELNPDTTLTELGGFSAVCYRLAYRDSIGDVQGSPDDTYHYALYRALADPLATFEVGMGTIRNDFLPSVNFWTQTIPVINLAHEDGPVREALDLTAYTIAPINYMASNIVDFRIIVQGIGEDVNGNPITVRHPRAEQYANDTLQPLRFSGKHVWVGVADAENPTEPFTPTQIQISLTVLPDAAMKRIQFEFGGQPSQDQFDAIVEREGQTFTSVIEIKNRIY